MKDRTLFIIIFVWLMLLLFGCKTKTVTEYVSVRDTVNHVIRDTVEKKVFVSNNRSDTEHSGAVSVINNTEKVNVEKTIVLNDKGDMIGYSLIKDHYHGVFQKDSSWYYKEKCDSLQSLVRIYKSNADSLKSAIVKEQNRTVVKKESCWASLKWKIATFSLLCALIVVLLRKYWSKIKDALKIKIFKS